MNKQPTKKYLSWVIGPLNFIFLKRKYHSHILHIFAQNILVGFFLIAFLVEFVILPLFCTKFYRKSAISQLLRNKQRNPGKVLETYLRNNKYIESKAMFFLFKLFSVLLPIRGLIVQDTEPKILNKLSKIYCFKVSHKFTFYYNIRSHHHAQKRKK